MTQSAENDKTYLEIEQDLRKRFRKKYLVQVYEGNTGL